MGTKKEYRVAECVYCKRVRFIAAKELCRACYQRQKKTGTLEPRIRTRTICKVDGCERIVISHGFCDLHWHRVQTTGDPNKTMRPDDWGKRNKHPLYYSWAYAKQNSGLNERWMSFWNFVADVKDRPTPTSRLYKLRETEPLGVENYEWREPLASSKDAASYAREHRKANPDYWKDTELRKNYGITLATYNAMLEKQGGVCAICKNPEASFEQRFQRTRNLAVDHCHTTNKVRGLLCTKCNRGIGCFGDDVGLLNSAIAYLKEHDA